MSCYADTGFVVSLYKTETTSARAAAVMGELTPPVWMSPLGELEMRNAFHLAVFRGELALEAAALKRRLFLEDEANGIFVVLPVPAPALYSKAADLAEQYSAPLGSRSLDLMHVAAALLLGAGTFLSFDDRQRKVATAEGLPVRPTSD